MSYEFYLDIYFLENLVINNTVLRMIAILEKKNCPRIRRFLTAAGGKPGIMSGDDVRNVPGKSTHGHSLYGSRDPDDNSCIFMERLENIQCIEQ